jgi:hypothetical protein
VPLAYGHQASSSPAARLLKSQINLTGTYTVQATVQPLTNGHQDHYPKDTSCSRARVMITQPLTNGHQDHYPKDTSCSRGRVMITQPLTNAPQELLTNGHQDHVCVQLGGLTSL